MPETVVIPTAGVGSRMGNLVERMHKCMLPYMGKPIIAYIIESFPKETRFIIPLGYLSWSVEALIKTMFHDRHIEFVSIKNYKEDGSGTALTLKECRSLINGPFWYVACDTYMKEPLPIGELRDNTYFVKKVPEDRSHLYTMMRQSSDDLEISFKETKGDTWSAFTGLMYIKDHERFFSDLESSDSIEFIHSLPPNAKLLPLETWIDMGNRESYLESVRLTEPYDFTKKGEMTWMVNGKVLKWASIWQQMLDRSKRAEMANPAVIPENVRFVDNMLVYDSVEGTTAYETVSKDLLPNILEWLRTEVWKPVPTGNFQKSCMEFYRTKSRERILGFVDQNKDVLGAKSVNGVAVGNWSNYLSKINWQDLADDNRPAWIHGDLQFDNIIVKKDGGFRAIDWRPRFSDERFAGDIYYDLSKLLGGCIINYSRIKKNEFSISDDGKGNYEIVVPGVDIDDPRETILGFTDKLGMNPRKVEQLVPLIFWNMAPLHAPPFDDLLWCLGLKLFSEIKNA